jgi:hypothetical protein
MFLHNTLQHVPQVKFTLGLLGAFFFLKPQIRTDVTLTLTLYATTVLCYLNCMHCLHYVFGDTISRRFWPPHTPHQNSCDFYWRSTVKD